MWRRVYILDLIAFGVLLQQAWVLVDFAHEMEFSSLSEISIILARIKSNFNIILLLLALVHLSSSTLSIVSPRLL